MVKLAFSGTLTINWLPSTVTRFRAYIAAQAERYNLDTDLIAIIMTLESGGYTKADSGYACGLMQIAPATASDIAAKFLHVPVTNYDIFDVETNIEFGTAYLAYLRDEFCDDTTETARCVELIAAGYNGGPGAANQLFVDGKLTYSETIIYSQNALNMWRERHDPTSQAYEYWLAAGGQRLVTKAAREKVA